MYLCMYMIWQVLWGTLAGKVGSLPRDFRDRKMTQFLCLTFNKKFDVFSCNAHVILKNIQSSTGVVPMIKTMNLIQAKRVLANDRNLSAGIYWYLLTRTNFYKFLWPIKPSGEAPHSSFYWSRTIQGNILTFFSCSRFWLNEQTYG